MFHPVKNVVVVSGEDRMGLLNHRSRASMAGQNSGQVRVRQSLSQGSLPQMRQSEGVLFN